MLLLRTRGTRETRKTALLLVVGSAALWLHACPRRIRQCRGGRSNLAPAAQAPQCCQRDARECSAALSTNSVSAPAARWPVSARLRLQTTNHPRRAKGHLIRVCLRRLSGVPSLIFCCVWQNTFGQGADLRLF